MSFNGSGTFNINSPGQPVVTGTAISSTAFNALTNDLAVGLTNTMTRDGQSPATGNIPFGGFKATGLANGTVGTDAATYAQLAMAGFAVNANRYGASSSASAAANAIAIQAAIDANPGKIIFCPDSSYSFDTKLEITTDNTRLYFPSCTLNFTGTGDAIHFYCTSTATTTTFVNGCGLLGNLTVYRATSDTSGAGVRLTQCNLFVYNNLRVDNFFGGYLQEGGQLIHGDSYASFMSPAVYPSVVAGAYQMKYTTAPIDGGLYQACFSTALSKIRTGGDFSAELGIVFEAADGVTIQSGYIAGSDQSLVRFKPSVSGKSISCVSLGTCYLDGKNTSSGTTNGIEVLDDGFAGASLVNNVDISACILIGNVTGKGLYSTHPNIQTFTVEPAAFVNCVGTEIDVASGDTSPDSWIGVLLPFTPTFTFATPGDFLPGYATQFGQFIRDRSGMIHGSYTITATPTFTTASGNLRITNIPIPTPAITTRVVGTLVFNGITKAGYTQFTPFFPPAAGSTMEILASGSGVASANVSASDMATGGFFSLIGSFSCPASELG